MREHPLQIVIRYTDVRYRDGRHKSWPRPTGDAGACICIAITSNHPFPWDRFSYLESMYPSRIAAVIKVGTRTVCMSEAHGNDNNKQHHWLTTCQENHILLRLNPILTG